MELLDAITREAMLFAAVGLLIGGVDDLAVDFIYLVRRWRRRRLPRTTLAALPPAVPGRLVVFVPAWDEVAVIGPMLRTAIERWGTADVRILVGTYPNDPRTIEAARAVAAEDARVRVVVGPRPGPTTKADCLNVLWRALADEPPATAVIVHDAEDVVHPAELDVFGRLIARHDVVQLPVEPLIDPAARFVSGCVADEFAETSSPLACMPQSARAVESSPTLPQAGSFNGNQTSWRRPAGRRGSGVCTVGSRRSMRSAAFRDRRHHVRDARPRI